MEFLEKDLEQVIYEADRDLLFEKGLGISGKLYRQKNLGGYGIADLISVKRCAHPYGSYLRVTIYELKQQKIGIAAFLQAIGYAKAIQHYFNKRGFLQYSLNIALIGKELDMTGTFCFLPDVLCNVSDYERFGTIDSVSFYTYKYELNGISFTDHSGYYNKFHNFKLKGNG